MSISQYGWRAFKDVFRGMGKAMLWFLLNMIFVSAPFWIIGILTAFAFNEKTKEIIDKEFSKLLKDCTISFVLCALIGATMVDFIFSKAIIGKKLSFIIAWFTFLPLLIVTIPYSFLMCDKSDNNDFHTLMNFQFGMIGYTFIYCTLVKTILFRREV